MKRILFILGLFLGILAQSIAHNDAGLECATINNTLHVFRAKSQTYNPKIKDAVIKNCQKYQSKSSHGLDFCVKYVVCIDRTQEVEPLFTCSTPEEELFDGPSLNEALQIARSELLFPCFSSANPIICFNENDKELTCTKNDEDEL